VRPEREPLFLALTHGRWLVFSPAVSFSADGEERRATDDGIHFHAADLHRRAAPPAATPSARKAGLRACVGRSADLPRPAERRYAVAAERPTPVGRNRKNQPSGWPLALRRENVVKRATGALRSERGSTRDNALS
jgi:hypothetical protein